MLTWGIIIAVTVYPGFKNLQEIVGGRSVVAAVLFTVALLALLILPVFFLADSLFAGIQSITAHIKSRGEILPPPPATIRSWPFIGMSLNNMWLLASKDLTELLKEFAPQIKAALPEILSATAGVGATLLQLLLSIVVSGVVLANAPAAYEMTRSLANCLFGESALSFKISSALPYAAPPSELSALPSFNCCSLRLDSLWPACLRRACGR